MTAPRRRKLWMVTHCGEMYRPESKVKAYGIYVRNAAGSYRSRGRDEQCRYANVYVDQRDGQGWQLFERVDLSQSD